jgi:REP element-mobilizing transposase RayT
MSRPLRIQFSGALYHVTSRGNRKRDIYQDDVDRARFLEVLEDVISSHNWRCHGYCLMDNHYHLIIETPDANLAKGMRQLNGIFTQLTNRRHDLVGHLFQGRYKAILVEKQSYLLELSRYVVLNPVRAGLVTDPGHWPWSSYRAMFDPSRDHAWLTRDWLLSQFQCQRREAISRYASFVRSGIKQTSIWEKLNQQIYLGDKNFIEKSLSMDKKTSSATDVPKIQQQIPVASIKQIAASHSSRDEAIVATYATGAYSYHDIADHYGLHYTSVGRIVRRGRS